MTTAGGSVTHILTNNTTTLLAQGLAVDSLGNLYYLNGFSATANSNYILRTTNPTNATPTFATYSNSGTGTIGLVYGLAIDSSNNLYVADALTPAYYQIPYVAPTGTSNVWVQISDNAAALNKSTYYDNANRMLWGAFNGSVVDGITNYNVTGTNATGISEGREYSLASGYSFLLSDTNGNITVVGKNSLQQFPGPFRRGDVWTDQTGYIWVCTGAGFPGTWQSVAPNTTGAAGAIPYSNGTTQTQLAIGGAGGLLTVNSGATAPTWTAIGTQGQVLTSTGTAPSWATLPSFTSPPNLNAFKAWAADPAVVTLSSAPSSSMAKGIGFYSAAYLTAGTIISNVYINIATAGVGLSNCYVGLFNATTRVAVSAAISTAWQTTSVVTNAFAASYTIPTTGIYYVAILFGNGSTTAPILSSTPGTAGLFNINTSASAGTLAISRMVSLGSGLTALPTSISGTPATGGYNFWWGLY